LKLETIRFDKPKIFSEVRTDMGIAQEEIFGPVLCILPCEAVE
jgi:aldehyde dehydrogenase (NAD+)